MLRVDKGHSSPRARFRSRESDPFNDTVHHWQLPVFKPTDRNVSQLNSVIAVPNEQDISSPISWLHGLGSHHNERCRRLGDCAETSPAHEGGYDGQRNVQQKRAGETPLCEGRPICHKLS